MAEAHQAGGPDKVCFDDKMGCPRQAWLVWEKKDQILYGPTGKLALMNGQSVSKAFIPLPAGATAVYTSGPTLSYFRHPDWLGTSRFASTASRTMYYSGAYAPFGETYSEAGTTDRSFTGQNQDTVPGSTAGLYDFTYREYAQYGRWISPDPAGLAAADPTNPQSWNRYAYVLNNPINAIDLFGLWWFGCDKNDPICIPEFQDITWPGQQQNCDFVDHYGGEGEIVTTIENCHSQDIPRSAPNGGGTKATTVPVPPPLNTSDCQSLADQITALRDDLAQRFSQYNNPTWDLPLIGTMSRQGHLTKIGNQQSQLRDLLNEYQFKGCGGGGGIPSDAWSWATRQAPALSPSPPGLPTPPWVKYVVGGAAVGLAICDILVPEVCLPATAAFAF